MVGKIRLFMRVLGLSALLMVELPLTNTAAPSIGHATQITVVFDLGGVLFNTNKRACMHELGLTNLIRYKLFARKDPEKLKERLYDALNRSARGNEPLVSACDPDGCQMPGLMCSWMTGQKQCQDIRNLICTRIEENPNWFSSSIEQRLVRRMARMMFDPARFAKTQKLVPDALPLVLRCKQQGHRLVVLSNWDRESFQIIRKQYRHFFDLFDEIFISGDAGSMKPSPEIFQLVTRNAAASSCIFVDNQQENLDTAQKLGFHTVLCQSNKGSLLSAQPDLSAVERRISQLEARLFPASSTPANYSTAT